MFHRQVFRIFVCYHRPLLILTFNFPFKPHAQPRKYQGVCVHSAWYITQLASTEVTVDSVIIFLYQTCEAFSVVVCT